MDWNKYKTYSDIYHSVYWFAETEEKKDIHGNFTRIGPNYFEAVINKIVFDLDSFIKDETTGIEHYTPVALKTIRKLNDWAMKKDLKRELRFSGGGFHFIIAAIGHPLRLKDGTLEILNLNNVYSDPSVIGDTAQMIRVRNSFNFGDHRKCFCIPLTEDEIYLSYKKIKKLAQKPRIGKRFIYGTEIYNFNHCVLDEDKIKLKELIINVQDNPDADKLLLKYGWEISDFCDTMKYIVGLKHPSNYFRYELIKYLRSIVLMSFDDCVNIIVALLKGWGIHSAMEGQARHVYGRRRRFNPIKLKGLGYCKFECNKCLNIMKIL